MFRITEDPSSGNLVQCLAKNYKNGSIVSVDMDKVGVIEAYSNTLCRCVVHCIGRHTGSTVSVDMDKVGVMAACSNPLCVCVVHCIDLPIQ